MSLAHTGRTGAADASARCQHLRLNGARCGSPAITHHNYCYFHQRLHEDAGQEIPVIEDAGSVQLAIMQILRGLATGMMEYKVAALMLYGLQIASANLKQLQRETALHAAELDAMTEGLLDALPPSTERKRNGLLTRKRRALRTEPAAEEVIA
jgi:hypothetical protein